MPRILLLLLILSLVAACGANSETEEAGREPDMAVEEITEESTPANMAPEFIEVLDAHGSLDTWNGNEAVTFRLRDFPTMQGGGMVSDLHRINLTDGDQAIRGDDYVVVSRGDTTYGSPGTNATGLPPRLYQSMSATLFGMPFVLAKPGITVVAHGQADFAGEQLLEFEASIPEDMAAGGSTYRLFVDPQSNQLQYATWMVTYPTLREQNLQRMVHFQEWQTVDGLVIPATVAMYSAPGEITPDAPGSTFYIEEVEFTAEPFAAETFDRPEDAVIDESYRE